MAFRVGQKVVCVDNRPRVRPVVNLTEGEIYTVIQAGIFLSTKWIAVAEADAGGNYGFFADRFRPVVSTDTGMAILEQIRRDVTNKELRPIFQDEQV